MLRSREAKLFKCYIVKRFMWWLSVSNNTIKYKQISCSNSIISIIELLWNSQFPATSSIFQQSAIPCWTPRLGFLRLYSPLRSIAAIQPSVGTYTDSLQLSVYFAARSTTVSVSIDSSNLFPFHNNSTFSVGDFRLDSPTWFLATRHSTAVSRLLTRRLIYWRLTACICPSIS